MRDLPRKLLLAIVIASVGVLVYVLFFWSNDEDEIRERLAELCTAVRVDPGETNPAVRALRLRGAFSEIFDKNVTVRIPELTEVGEGRAELAQVAAQAAALWERADVSLDDLAIEIDAAKTTAHVEGNATLSATDHGGRLRRDERKVSFRLEKIDGEWRITSIGVAPSAEEEAP